MVVDHDGPDHLEGELGGQQRDRGAPDLMTGLGFAERVQQEPDGDRDDGDHGEDLRPPVDKPLQHRAGARELKGERAHARRMARAAP